MSEPDYILDVDGLTPDGGPDQPVRVQSDGTGRPFISVHFTCCRSFARVYRNRAGTAYVGWCPRCARKVVARIGPDGTSARLFTAR